MRSDPDKRPTDAERGGAITGIVVAPLAVIGFLVLGVHYICKEWDGFFDGELLFDKLLPCTCFGAIAAPTALFLLCLSIATIQEIRPRLSLPFQSSSSVARLVRAQANDWSLVPVTKHEIEPVELTQAAKALATYDFDFYDEYFYEEDCVRMLSPGGECGIDALNDVLGTFTGELRVEAVFGTAIVFLLLIGLLQLGGAPIPDPKEQGGTILWYAWMMVAVGQWATMGLSLVSTIAAYVAMRTPLSACALEWKHGMNLVDVVALPTFSFQPSVVLTKIVVLLIYFAALIEGYKVWLGANVPKNNNREGFRKCLCCGNRQRNAFQVPFCLATGCTCLPRHSSSVSYSDSCRDPSSTAS